MELTSQRTSLQTIIWCKSFLSFTRKKENYERPGGEEAAAENRFDDQTLTTSFFFYPLETELIGGGIPKLVQASFIIEDNLE